MSDKTYYRFITEKEIQIIKLRRIMRRKDVAEKMGIPDSAVSQIQKRFEIKKASLIVTFRRLIDAGLLDDADIDIILKAIFPNHYEKLKRLASIRGSDSLYKFFSTFIDDCLKSVDEEIRNILSDKLGVIEEKLKVVGVGVESPSGKIVDILARDKDNRLVVIEVKLHEVSGEDILQLYRYVEDYKRKYPNVRGVIVAPSIDDTAKRMLRSLNLEYKILTTDEIKNLEGKA